MNILVTGCAGFIGSHLSERLLHEGHTVIGLDNMNQFYDTDLKQKNLLAIELTAEKLKRDFIFYVGDIRSEATVGQILREHSIDAIIHLAAMAGVRPSLANPLLYNDVNVVGTNTLLEQARLAGVRRFIFGSSSSVYGNSSQVPFSEEDPALSPISPYAATKRAGELMCHVYHQLYQMNIICLRFFTVYGPRQRPDLAIRKFAALMLGHRKVPVFGDGSMSRDFTYVDDIIHGVYKALERVNEGASPRFEIFNLGESKTITVNEMLDALERSLGVPADRQHLPEQAGDVRITYANIVRAREVLGYNPQTDFETGIKKFSEWMKNL